MIKQIVISRITFGMSIYSLKMLWRDCTNYNSVGDIIFHDDQISHLVFLYVLWLNDTYNNWTVTEKTCLRWFVTIKAQASLRIHAVSSATFLSAFWEESSLDLPRAKKINFLSSLFSRRDLFETHFVWNPEDRFSCVVACVACSTALGQIFQVQQIINNEEAVHRIY